ncbi:MAG: hypothetical protein ABH969_01185 [Pseudomonadota bacterium]
MKIKRKMKFFIGAALLSTAMMALLPCIASAQKDPIPWTFGGYEKIEMLHIKYWMAGRDTLASIESFQKLKLDSEIQEIWYKKSGSQFRVDKYIEMGSSKCNQFKGKEWEKISQDGKTYGLKDRIIQSGPKRVTLSLQNISSGGGKELCEYKRSEMTRRESNSIKDALQLLALIPYLANPEFKEMALSILDLEKAMNPDQYKKTIAELKKRQEIQGRKTAKWNTNHGLIKFIAKGYALVDLEWRMGLEGYLTGGQQGQGQPAVVFQNPVCIYKVLSLETKVPDGKVFEN